MRQVNSNNTKQSDKNQKSRVTQVSPSAIRKMFAKEFVSNPENYRWSQNEKIQGRYNRYGFFNVLSGGFDSTGTNTLEIGLPDNFDLSIEQKSGFSIFFWFLAKKQPNNILRYILKKGNSIDELTPCIGLLPNNTNLFAKLTTNRQKVESMISNKKIEHNRIYSCAMSVLVNHEEELTEMSLYIDGALDSQISIPGEPMHNQGSVWLGKPDSTTNGFVGTLCDVMLIPRSLTEEEIVSITSDGLQNLLKTNGEMFNTSGLFEQKFERIVLMDKYLIYTQSTPYIVNNLQLSNSELKEIVKKYDEEERKADPPIEEIQENPIEKKMLTRIDEMFQNYDDMLIVKKIYLNSKFINTVVFLINKGEDLIELKRIIDIFDILSENLLFNFDLTFLTKLAKNLNALNVEIKTIMSISIFFKNLKMIHDIYFPDEIINTQSQQGQYDEREKSNIEMYENSLLNNMKNINVFDNDNNESLNYKNSFMIKALYVPKEKLQTAINKHNKNIEEDEAEQINNEEEVKKPQLTEEEKTAIKFVDSVFGNEDQKESDLFMTGTKKEHKRKNVDEQEGGNEEGEDEDEVEARSNKEEIVHLSNTEKHEYDPDFPKAWADGTFEIVINHCVHCHQHSKTTRHYEYSYVDKFNEIAEAIREIFPNVYIVGNYDDMEYFGCFDVYLRGLGPVFDNKNRFFIFKKSKTGRFPFNTEITDKLITLSMVYGSSQNMESAQKQFFKQTSLHKRSTHFHDFPAVLSDDGEKAKNQLLEAKREPAKIEEHTKFWCSNWGCGQTYMYIDNKKGCCQFHPGVWQFGSYNGYWPECWSCCENEWQSSGCTIGLHKGIRVEERLQLCLHHGEVNPNTKHPDSACGHYFTRVNKSPLNKNKDEKEEICQYHSGYIENGSFTCCGSDAMSRGCIQSTHESVEFPNAKAKLYFYPKPIKNPGTISGIKNSISIVGLQICKCDYFKNIKVPYENVQTKHQLLQMKRKKEASEPRYCMNWGCEQIYYEKDNEKNQCCCHPGKWDHGCTGTKLADYVQELKAPDPNKKKTILWQPHWTCCHEDWNVKGCKIIKHKGPLISSLGEKPTRYKWPNIRLKLFFNKIITDNWRMKLQKITYDEYSVRKICRKFFNCKKTINDLPALCDLLKIYLLVVNDNVDYSLKFMDIATQKNTVQYFINKDDHCVDLERFIQWWFAPYEELLNVLYPKDLPIPIIVEDEVRK